MFSYLQQRLNNYHGSGTKSGPKRRFADIRLCNAANVLDHCTLLPGVTVAELVPCNKQSHRERLGKFGLVKLESKLEGHTTKRQKSNEQNEEPMIYNGITCTCLYYVYIYVCK